MDQKLQYVLQNPVKGGLVSQAEDYLLSSARDYAGENSQLKLCLLLLISWCFLLKSGSLQLLLAQSA